MLEIAIPYDPRKNDDDARELARLRRIAKKRGFRIVRGYPGWSLIDTKIKPPRPVLGFLHVRIEKIEAALLTPLPLPRSRRASTSPGPSSKLPADACASAQPFSPCETDETNRFAIPDFMIWRGHMFWREGVWREGVS
jgi:hypothetical protein